MKKLFLVFLIATFFEYFSFSQKNELVVQTGHSLSINDLAFSPDGKILASCGNDNVIILWDVLSGKQIRTISGHTGPVTQVVFHPGKYILASISEDNTVKIWDYKNGNNLKTLVVDEGSSLDFNQKGDRLIASGKNIIVWQCNDWINLNNEITTDTVKIDTRYQKYDFIKFSHTNTLFGVCCRKEGDIIIYDLENQQTKRVYKLKCNAIAFSRDDNYLVGAGVFGKIRRWDLNSKLSFITRYSIPERKWTDSYLSVAISPDAEFFAGGNQNRKINIFHIKNGKTKLILKAHTSKINGLRFSPENKYLASAGKDRKIHIWNIEDGQLVKTLESYGSQISCSRIKNNLILSGNTEGFCKIIETVPNGNLYNYEFKNNPFKNILGWRSSIKDLKFLDDSLNIIIEADIFKEKDRYKSYKIKHRNKFVVWNARTGDVTKIHPKISQNQFSENDFIVFKKEGIRLKKISYQEDRNKWSFQKITSLPALPHLKSINNIWSGDDGEYIIISQLIADSTKIQILDSELETLIHEITLTSGITDLKYIPSGNQLFVAYSNQTIQIFDLQEDQLLVNYQGLPPLAVYEENLICLDLDNNILSANIRNASIRTLQTSHTSKITSINWFDNNTKLMTGSEDGTMKLFSPENSNQIGSIIPIEKDDIIYITPQNYYTATKGALKGVGFSINEKIFAFDQFDLKYNRPDIVYQDFELVPPDLIKLYNIAYQKRLKSLSITENDLNDSLISIPYIYLDKDTIPLYSKEKVIKIPISAWDENDPLDNIFITVNGVPVHGSQGWKIENETQDWNGDIPVVLSDGNNYIQLYARNSKGVNSLKESIEIFHKEQKRKPDLYVVAIGVSKYKDAGYNLRYAEKDARDLFTLFLSQKNKFNTIIFDTIFNENATRENIIKTKEKLLQSDVDDVVILFSSGHGLIDNNLDYYLATYDVDFDNPSERGLSYEALEYLLDGIPARKKLMLIDACHSGEVDKDDISYLAVNDTTQNAKGNVKAKIITKLQDSSHESTSTIGLENSFELMKELYADLRKSSGAFVISSASGIEYAYEDEKWENGAFTYCLIEGLSTGNADINKDKKIQISELHNYALERVQYLTSKRQNPTTRSENLEFDFTIW